MTDIRHRKKDHVELCLTDKVLYDFSSGFDAYHFVHNALPELNLSDIDTSAVLLQRRFRFPLFISSMTGGYAEAGPVNAIIAEVCEELNLPFGVGSQRAMLVRPEEVKSFSIVREKAPNAFIAANLGGCQLIEPNYLDQVDIIIKAIKADACIIHLNPLQELMQPEGDRAFKGILPAIKALVHHLNIPVIVKETGAGMSPATVTQLVEVGVKVIDVAGSGGTSWAKVENLRQATTDPAELFNNWGIPTVQCLEWLVKRPRHQYDLIASGGIRSVLDMGKALCLGADFCATAQPIIKAIHQGGAEGLKIMLLKWQKEFSYLMLLLGVHQVDELSLHHIYKKS